MESTRPRPDDDRPADEAGSIRCPFCKGGLEPGALAGACAACGTLHHVGCFAEHAGCSVHGCLGARAHATRVGEAPPLDFPGLLCGACNQPVAQEAMVARCGGCAQSLHVACYEQLRTCAMGSRGLCRGAIEVMSHIDAAALHARRTGTALFGVGGTITVVAGAAAILLHVFGGHDPQPAVVCATIAALGVAMCFASLRQLAKARSIEASPTRQRKPPPPAPRKE